MAKVKEYLNWEVLIFEDGKIYRSDLKQMSWKRIQMLDEFEVALAEENGKVLVIEDF